MGRAPFLHPGRLHQLSGRQHRPTRSKGQERLSTACIDLTGLHEIAKAQCTFSIMPTSMECLQRLQKSTSKSGISLFRDDSTASCGLALKHHSHHRHPRMHHPFNHAVHHVGRSPHRSRQCHETLLRSAASAPCNRADQRLSTHYATQCHQKLHLHSSCPPCSHREDQRRR